MFKRVFSALPGVGAALLPNVTCPACWPVYAGILSAVGLGFLMTGPYFYLIVGGMLFISLYALYHRAKSRRGYSPLFAGLAASAIIFIGKATDAGDLLMYLGAGLLVAASIWNNWPRKNSRKESKDAETTPCPACNSTNK